MIAALLVGSGTATASTFHVTRTDDPAPGACKRHDCSLREAILAANAHAGRDTVVANGRETYDLEIAGADEDDGLAGDLDIRGKLRLAAVGGGRATIDAHGLDRVIDIFKRTALLRLEITGGDLTIGGTGSGGGVQASALTRLVSDKVDANTGRGVTLNGGGTLTNSILTGNDGGGLSAFDDIAVVHSTIKGNQATGPGTGAAGVADFSGQSTIKDSRIVHNTSDQACGGASLSGSLPTVTNSVFARNHSDMSGGALCILSNGSATVAVSDSRFTKNTANGSGGALYLGTLHGIISRVTFDGNEAVGGGGAIHVVSPDLTISRSTFSNNRATGVASGSGGGIWADGTGHLRLVNSTLAQNEAAASGGAIFNSNPGGNAGNVSHVELAFTSIAFNNGDSDGLGGDIGGGIMQGVNAAYDDVHGTLIAHNTAAGDPDCAATVTSVGHNVLTDTVGCTGFDRPSDHLTAAPKIGALSANGGPTETVPLKKGSPAIDKGGKKCPPTDQRGVSRPQGPHCDVGAFERR